MLCYWDVVARTSLSTSGDLGYKTVYEEDFSQAPGYESMKSDKVYWDSAAGNYFAEVHDVSYNYEYYLAKSPSFTKINPDLTSFVIEFDVNPVQPDWGCYPRVRFVDSSEVNVQADSYPGRSIAYDVVHWSDHVDKKMRISTNITDTSYKSPTVTADTWYRVRLAYDASSNKINWTVKNKTSGDTFHSATISPDFDSFDQIIIGQRPGDPKYGDYAQIRVDNIRVAKETTRALPEFTVDGYDTVYVENFSKDPGYNSMKASKVYWDSGAGNYFAEVHDVSYNYEYYLAKSPAFTEKIFPDTNSFIVEFDANPVLPDWGCYPNLTFVNSTRVDVTADSYPGRSFIQKIASWSDFTDKQMVFKSAPDWEGKKSPTASSGTWYRFRLKYDAATGKMEWTIINWETGEVFHSSTFKSELEPFDQVIIGDRTGGTKYGDYAQIRVDNIRVSKTEIANQQMTSFSEDWEAGIDTSVWNVWGSPAPELIGGEGINNSWAMDPNGDGWCNSGMWTKQPIKWEPGSEVSMRFKTQAHGEARQSDWQNIQLRFTSGWRDASTSCGPSDGVNSLLNLAIRPKLGSEKIRLHTNTTIFEKSYPPEKDGIWHEIKIRAKADKTVEVLLDGEIIGQSQTAINLGDTTHLAIMGRSDQTTNLVDNISFGSGSSSDFAEGSVIFEEDFSDLTDWKLVGTPQPQIETDFAGKSNVFDNNGDGSYDSLGVLKESLPRISPPFAVEADMYLNMTDPSGCWVQPSLSFLEGNQVDPRQSIPRFLRFKLHYQGDACWAFPSDLRRHAYLETQFVNESGTWVKGPSEPQDEILADTLMNQWNRFKVVVDEDWRVGFYVNSELIFKSTDSINRTKFENWYLGLGERSSASAGKAYHDNLKVYQIADNPSVSQGNFDNRTASGNYHLLTLGSRLTAAGHTGLGTISFNTTDTDVEGKTSVFDLAGSTYDTTVEVDLLDGFEILDNGSIRSKSATSNVQFKGALSAPEEPEVFAGVKYADSARNKGDFYLGLRQSDSSSIIRADSGSRAIAIGLQTPGPTDGVSISPYPHSLALNSMNFSKNGIDRYHRESSGEESFIEFPRSTYGASDTGAFLTSAEGMSGAVSPHHTFFAVKSDSFPSKIVPEAWTMFGVFPPSERIERKDIVGQFRFYKLSSEANVQREGALEGKDYYSVQEPIKISAERSLMELSAGTKKSAFNWYDTPTSAQVARSGKLEIRSDQFARSDTEAKQGLEDSYVYSPKYDLRFYVSRDGRYMIGADADFQNFSDTEIYLGMRLGTSKNVPVNDTSTEVVADPDFRTRVKVDQNLFTGRQLTINSGKLGKSHPHVKKFKEMRSDTLKQEGYDTALGAVEISPDTKIPSDSVEIEYEINEEDLSGFNKLTAVVMEGDQGWSKAENRGAVRTGNHIIAGVNSASVSENEEGEKTVKLSFNPPHFSSFAIAASSDSPTEDDETNSSSGGSCLIERMGASNELLTELRQIRDSILETVPGRWLTETYYEWFGK